MEGGALLRPIVEDADAEGFHGVTFPGDGHNASYGRMLARVEGDGLARVRIETGRRAGNVQGHMHGGFLLSFLDQALFVGPVSLDRLELFQAVTLTLSTQFLAPGKTDRPLDCMVEIVRETGRLVFLRGTMEQGETVLLIWQATLRKLGPKAA